MTITEKTYNTIQEFYKVWQSGSLQEFQKDKDIIQCLESLQGNSGILRNDMTIANFTATAFLFGVFIATRGKQPETITMNEQQQASRCLSCDKIDYSNGSFRCKVSKCRYE